MTERIKGPDFEDPTTRDESPKIRHKARRWRRLADYLSARSTHKQPTKAQMMTSLLSGEGKKTRRTRALLGLVVVSLSLVAIVATVRTGIRLPRLTRMTIPHKQAASPKTMLLQPAQMQTVQAAQPVQLIVEPDGKVVAETKKQLEETQQISKQADEVERENARQAERLLELQKQRLTKALELQKTLAAQPTPTQAAEESASPPPEQPKTARRTTPRSKPSVVQARPIPPDLAEIYEKIRIQEATRNNKR